MNEPTRKRQVSRKLDERKAVRFLEEFSWLLDRYADVDLRRLARLLERPRLDQISELKDFVPRNPNQLLLVGVLPGMFTDENLFPSNEDIAEFAEKVLDLRLLRWTKKSKFELIGLIVCNLTSADDEKLSRVANALRLIASGDTRARHVITRGRLNRKGWNEIIQELIEGA